MNIVITRRASVETGTQGELRVQETGFCCDTLELKWDGNKPDTSCVVADSYTASIWFSPHLQRDVLRLEDKHGRTGVLIHNGNFAGDVSIGEVSQVKGCTEVGKGFGLIRRADGEMQLGILNSVITLTDLLTNIGSGPHLVTYQWIEGAAPV